jgi:hypothetical protein
MASVPSNLLISSNTRKTKLPIFTLLKEEVIICSTPLLSLPKLCLIYINLVSSSLELSDYQFNEQEIKPIIDALIKNKAIEILSKFLI